MGLGKYFFGGVLFYFVAMMFFSQLQAQTISLNESLKLDVGIQNLINESWAFKNTGAVQVFDLSPLQAYRLQARVGQDLQLPPPAIPKIIRKIRVAILDTGVDVNHPGIFNQIARNSKECSRLEAYKACLKDSSKLADACSTEFLDTKTAANDNDQNNYPMDCTGWSVLSDPTPNNILGTPIMNDPIGHGTHVASLVAQVSKNIEIIPVQVLGEKFSPNQPIKPFSIDLSPNEDVRNGFDYTGGEIAQVVARGIIYAIHAKADVINLSIGWPQLQDHEVLRDAIAEAQKNGIIIVAAAGNDSTSALLRPCQYDGVICVAATRPDGSLASFSNFGFGVDVAAPGVSITSLVPTDHRSIRLPGYFGIDILSGTSQASPLVAGLIAEMLSRGIPKNQIYPRLILGSRDLQTSLPVLVGPVNKPGIPVDAKAAYEKTILGGQVDGKRAITITPQPLILNANKRTEQIIWNRQSLKLPLSFSLKNYWKSVQGAIEIQLVLTNQNSVLPKITKLNLDSSGSATTTSWNENEEKSLSMYLEIVDTKIASQSRIPRELNFEARVLINGKLHRQFPLRAEVVAKLDLNLVDKDDEVQSIPLSRGRQQGEKFFLIDEIYDNQPNNRDYFLLNKGEKDFGLALARMTDHGYEISAPKKFKIDGNIGPTKPLHRIRIDVDQDGVSEYIISLQEFDTSGQIIAGSNSYKLHFFILNSDLTVKKYFKFDDKRVLFPTDFTWLKVGHELRPAWVAQGFKISNPAPIDSWGDDDDYSPTTVKLQDENIYFYYLNQNFEIAQVETKMDLRIVDVLQASVDQIRQGQVPVLVAKNLGTPNKPSFLNEFSMGWILNGQLTNLKKIEDLAAIQGGNYRNLIDTRKDKSLNLGAENSEYKGNFWFGFDAHQKQRVSMIDFNSMKFVDQLLASEQKVFDAPLRIRSAYSGTGRSGDGAIVNKQAAFVMTNTEIEYHDLSLKQKARTSLNKYTFIGDDLIVDLQFPLTLSSRDQKKIKTAALFTTEGSGLSSSLRILTADYQRDGSLIGLVSPARLSLQSPEGCRPLDFPFYLNQEYALDYDCGTKFIRVKLKY
jgi:hypothetical protein